MKICFIAPASSAHTEKWCRWFAGRGHEVYVISFVPGAIPEAQVHYIQTVSDAGTASEWDKLRYLFHGWEIRRLLDEIRPDVVNAHYATSYGTAAALAGIKGYVCSVWGSDIYDFPRKSPLHRWMLQYSLKKAAYLFSTSQAMADEAGKYTKKPFAITPFGVDMELFSPDKRRRTGEDGNFVIGTVKALSPQYGIDCLLKAAALVRKEHPEIPLRVRIAGKGEAEAELKELADALGISDIVTWLGFIPQEEAAREWSDMDVAAVPSTAFESFGVSAVEAQACGTPVIISDVPGLMEATCPGKSSLVVPRGDERALADAIAALYADPERRASMGRNGRGYVMEKYELNSCFGKIEELFYAAAKGSKGKAK